MKELHVELHKRPKKSVISEIVSITRLLTVMWFTHNVPEDTEKDLLFQEVLCLKEDKKILSFIIFTCWDGSIHITLIGTHPDYRGKGYGSRLIEYFFDYIKEIGFDKIVALTVPPDIKQSYFSTVDFYKKHGFVLNRRYNDMWESGAIELVKNLF